MGDVSQDVVREKGKGILMESNVGENIKVDNSSSEDKAMDITFDNNEDERALGINDEFFVLYACSANGSSKA